MARVGRPSKLSDELSKQICDLIATEGLHRKHAAAKVGIPERTVANWYHRGAREERGPHRDFYFALDAAEATFAETCLTMLKARGAHDVKVLQWLLSRRFPEIYGRKDNVEDKSPEDRAAQAQATRTLLMERLERLAPEPEAPKVDPPALAVLPRGAPDAVA